MKVAVVGATGLVGNVMLEVLAERNFPVCSGGNCRSGQFLRLAYGSYQEIGHP